MPNERSQLRGTVLVEDRRTEHFFRQLLERMGFTTEKIRFSSAPRGKGSAEAWVRKQFPIEVKLLRSKNYQRLFLIAVRDGDNQGVAPRKSDLNMALIDAGLRPRENDEHIATPVPTWSIETWLLALLAESDITENKSYKAEFNQKYGEDLAKQELRVVVDAWLNESLSFPSVPSIYDGKNELIRIYFT